MPKKKAPKVKAPKNPKVETPEVGEDNLPDSDITSEVNDGPDQIPEEEEESHGKAKEEKGQKGRLLDEAKKDAIKKTAESKTVLDQPLEPGQRLFETPEGEIIVGESEKQQVWSRRMNGGKGGWANPKR